MAFMGALPTHCVRSFTLCSTILGSPKAAVLALSRRVAQMPVCLQTSVEFVTDTFFQDDYGDSDIEDDSEEVDYDEHGKPISGSLQQKAGGGSSGAGKTNWRPSRDRGARHKEGAANQTLKAQAEVKSIICITSAATCLMLRFQVVRALHGGATGGLVLITGETALCYTLTAKTNQLGPLTKCPGKKLRPAGGTAPAAASAKGGQSALRYARLAEDAREKWIKKVAERVNEVFLDADGLKVCSVAVIGAKELRRKLQECSTVDGRVRSTELQAERSLCVCCNQLMQLMQLMHLLHW